MYTCAIIRPPLFLLPAAFCSSAFAHLINALILSIFLSCAVMAAFAFYKAIPSAAYPCCFSLPLNLFQPFLSPLPNPTIRKTTGILCLFNVICCFAHSLPLLFQNVVSFVQDINLPLVRCVHSSVSRRTPYTLPTSRLKTAARFRYQNIGNKFLVS